jgi:hypothetical protein
MYVKNSEEKSEKLIFKSETNKTSNLWENFKRVFLNSEKQDSIKCEHTMSFSFIIKLREQLL